MNVDVKEVFDISSKSEEIFFIFQCSFKSSNFIQFQDIIYNAINSLSVKTFTESCSHIFMSVLRCTTCACMEKNVEFGHLIPGKFSLLDGNICNFEGKCTI